LGLLVRLRFASRSPAMWRVCAFALSFVSGWRAFSSVSLCKSIIFTVKTVDGCAFDRRKVRLVAKGFKLRHGIDYRETWAPTGRMMTLRATNSHAVVHKYEMRQADVTQAFLHGKLDEPFWGRLPDGTLIQIQVSVHGTKKGAYAWWRMSVEALQGLGYTRMSADLAIYVAEGVRGVRKLIHSHVDDFTLVGPLVKPKKTCVNASD
jgi:hypothetical protein